MENEMKQSKKISWKLAALASILVLGGVLLVACNNGSSGGTNIPPVPPVVIPSDPNGEGVRDDVRRYIETTHQDSAKARAALFQYAKVVEKALADANDKQLSVQHAEESNRASECLTYTLGDDVAAVDKSYAMKKDLRSVILNTDERNKAYFIYNDQLGGEVFKGTPSAQIASTCNIDPSTLPN